MESIYSRDGIGTKWWFELLGGTTFPVATKRAINEAMDMFNRDYTRFTDTSFVGQLNLNKIITNFPPELYDMLVFAQDMYRASDGIFDISVGGALHAKGYGDRKHAGRVHQKFWDETKITREKITIPRESVIDLGGLGKGWLIDRLVEVMRACGHEQFIVNGGGDMYVHSDAPIEIALQHPTKHDQKIGQTLITHGALAVSSTVMRRWQHEGREHHHIIDPRTSESSQSDVISTYVRADTALIADVMATILIVNPTLDARLSKKFDLQTILVRANQLAD
ncbi:MAG: FAD:protein FMN transferase [Candidatus Saccharimonadales bacterium]